MSYKNMNKKEILEQLEWSDNHEFSYGYSIWAYKILNKIESYIYELKQNAPDEKTLDKILEIIKGGSK